MMRRPPAPLAALLTLLAAACLGEGKLPPGAPGSPAPAFRAATLEGDTVALADLRGAPVLVNLWATWCAPCRRETPFLQSVHERFSGRGLQVLGVTTDSRGAVRDVHAFLEEFGVTYRILHDPDARSMDLFSAIGLPATYLIGADGTILWSKLGEVREDDRSFEEAVEAAVGKAEEGPERP